MTLAKISIYLFYVGAISLVIGFVLHVVHTTLLATARRAVTRLSASTRLAGAGAGGGSSTVDLSGSRWSAGRSASGWAPGRSGPAAAGLGSTSQTTSGSIGHAFTWISFLLIAASMAVRAYLVGRGPWGNMYEFSIAFAFGIVGGYLFLQRRYPIRSIAFLPLGVALFLVGYALTLPAEIEPLVPALENPPLLTIHVAMAMISYGIFATSFGAAVGYLAQGPQDRFAWLPSHKILDEVAYRAVIVGFPIFATLIVLGSWWASIAWGRYWGWDPKETSALVTWLIYAAYLHARNQRGWAGRPAALILVVGFGAVLFTYFGNLFFSGLHSYSGL
jgi:cytochrome c-type biogenesis protein CcsB